MTERQHPAGGGQVPPVPYGATGERESGSPPPALGGRWHSGPPVEHRPSAVIGGLLIACAVATAGIVVWQGRWQDAGEVVSGVVLGACALAAALAGAHLLRSRVRIDGSGMSIRGLIGVRTWGVAELDAPVLYRHRQPRLINGTGGHHIVRLAIRRSGGRYGRVLSSPIWSVATLESLAEDLGAIRSALPRPTAVEQRYPGSTRIWHRYPRLTWVVLGVAIGVLAMVGSLLVVVLW